MPNGDTAGARGAAIEAQRTLLHPKTDLYTFETTAD